MMHAASFLAATSAMIGGLPAFPRGRRRRLHKPDPVAQAKAAAKRHRKAAKREEDARRTEEGRARQWASPWVHWSSYPLGIWDREERWCSGLAPRWRQRLNHRRSLPWVGWLWLDSHAQWRRLFSPRSFMTRAWRRMKRERGIAAARKEFSR